MSKEYRPLKDLSIFVTDESDHFIIGKHTSHDRVKVSYGYSCNYTYVSNYQANNYDDPDRAMVYIDALIEMYEKLMTENNDDSINWAAVHAETIETLLQLKHQACWHYLGQGRHCDA